MSYNDMAQAVQQAIKCVQCPIDQCGHSSFYLDCTSSKNVLIRSATRGQIKDWLK